jgi:hypothetical protein
MEIPSKVMEEIVEQKTGVFWWVLPYWFFLITIEAVDHFCPSSNSTCHIAFWSF